MRLLHLIPNLSGGGTERQLSYLTPELVRLGHEVHIAYSKEGPNKPQLPGVVLHQLSARSNYDPYVLWQLIRLIRSIKPDIIHTWILQMDILGALAAKICGFPCMLREPSSARAYPPTLKNRLRILAAAGARAVVSNSIGGDEYWQGQLPLSRRYIVRNGIPAIKNYTVAAALPPILLESSKPIVLYVGRLTSDVSATKNLTELLKALALVKKTHDVLGVLCGEGPQQAELENLRRNLDLDSSIHFTGHIESASIWALMKSASVFISLSEFEGCPNTVTEAMACGCPLILSDITAHREILDETCACFVNPTDTQQIADAIVRSLFDRETAIVRAQIAKLKTQKWSINEMARSYEKIYNELV